MSRAADRLVTPTLRLSGRPLTRSGADLLVLPCFAVKGGVEVGPGAQDLAGEWGIDVGRLLAAVPSFRGEPGQSAPVPVIGDGRPRLVLAVGLGLRSEADAGRVRDAAQLAARTSDGHRTLATTLPQVGADPGAAVRATAEGLLLGGYRYASSARGGRNLAREAVLLVAAGQERRALTVQALRTGRTAGELTSWVRQLVETPGGQLTPADLAAVLRDRGREVGVGVRVWSGRTLQSKGFGGVLGVGAGSRNTPVVVELRGGEGPAPATLGLAGKGITFDSGGLNLKRDPDEISWMKSDMAGAAAVAGAVFAAAALGAGTAVRAVLPLAENMPGGSALRPGDVLTHPDGRTTEVTDTDCEGRLVLADAVAHLASTKPAAIIDVGTLTDGGGVGNALWGCWATDRGLAAELVAAGQATGDPGWELPLRPEYQTFLSSQVADLVNCSQDVPDSGQLAATYLRTFAGTTPWVHVDNGSSAYLELERPPWPKGATGSPARALLELLIRHG